MPSQTTIAGPPAGRWRDSHGVTLIEAVIAMAILSTVLIGLLGASGTALRMTENHGHLDARTAEYAQDKMEQLLGLVYGDAQSDTTVFPAANTGGTGLAVGGSLDGANPVVGYVDYLNETGTLVTGTGGAAPANWFYQRLWQISSPATDLKQITVRVVVARSVGLEKASEAIVSSLKTNPF